MAQNNVFNPVKEEVDGVRARRIVWSTTALEAAIKGLNDGRKLIANPFYENKTKILKGDLVFQRTQYEIEEWKKCSRDILYFVNKYCKLMTPQGVKNITLRNYQENYLEHLTNNRLSIYLACRQCGKTTTSALFMLHYIIFNIDKNALVLGNKRKTAIDILSKTKEIFMELPYFLKPGVYKWNESEIALDNGCRLMAEATTVNSGIGMTLHICLLDEFAHVHNNIVDKFYNNIFPTITAAKARFIISSTQNGYNLFYRLCRAAEAHENEYGFFKTDWDEVPEWNPEKQCWEKRDEEWHRMQVANYGSEEAFNAQFGTSFDVKANTLIDTKILRKFEKESVEFVNKELPGIPYADSFFFHPDYDINQMKNHFFVITTDISEGIGGDYTVYLFNKMCLRPKDDMVYTETIGFFKNNKVNAETATTILKEFCQNYLNINNYLISLEYNLYGELFAKYIIDKIEKDPANVFRFNEDVIMKYWNEEMTKYTLGKKITSKSKQFGITRFKQYYEKQEVVNVARQFVVQLSNFCDIKENGCYAASFGHDDLVMAQLQMAFVIENPQYKSLCQMFMASQNALEINNSYDPFADMGAVQFSPSQFVRGGSQSASQQQIPNYFDIYSGMGGANPGNLFDIYPDMNDNFDMYSVQSSVENVAITHLKRF